MKKQILFSILTIGIIASMLGASTFAYFSDIETSTGNTFTAGTIDLSAPFDIIYSPGDLKPCQTRYLTLKVHNDGTNEMDVWKHIKNVTCAENGINEPEQDYYDTNDINYLLGYWRFEETTPWNNVPDEVIDNSSFENHGTANGAQHNTNGKVDQCAEFDGSNDYVSIPDSTSLDISGAITVTAWIKIDSFQSGEFYTVAGKWNDRNGNYRSYLLGLSTKDTTNPQPKFYISTNGVDFPSAKSSETLNTGVWYHLAGTFDSNELKIYVNGVEKGSYTFASSTSIALNDEPLLIAGDRAGGNGGRYYDGLIDEVTIWNGVLDASEIEDLYDNPGVIETSGKNDIDTVILYDMWIDNDGDTSECNEAAGDVWIIQESEGFHIDDIECRYIYLGTLAPDETMIIVQSYHMEADTGNWAQSDTMTFDIEFFAQQTPGNPPPPESELPGHGKSDR